MADAVLPSAIVPDVDASEADVPRWRRESVKAARFGAVAATASAGRRPMLVFATPPDAETGRWVVRFDAVALLTEPDEVFGQRVVELDAGDEVEMTGHRAAWYQVRTPRGQEGWLQSMTVEPFVDGHRPAAAPSPAEPEPEAPVDEVAEESQLDVAPRRDRGGPRPRGGGCHGRCG